MHTLNTFCSNRARNDQHNQHPHCLHTWPEHSPRHVKVLTVGEGVCAKSISFQNE